MCRLLEALGGDASWHAVEAVRAGGLGEEGEVELKVEFGRCCWKGEIYASGKDGKSQVL